MFKAICISLLLSIIPLSAYATASTHIWAPSTDVQAYGLWHITSDMYLYESKTDAEVRYPTVTNLGLTVGVLPFKNYNLELGWTTRAAPVSRMIIRCTSTPSLASRKTPMGIGFPRQPWEFLMPG